tara:strand:- start:11501 stop:12025 length:525 start_codon:yes stop_codon:yes gene_type:complete
MNLEFANSIGHEINVILGLKLIALQRNASGRLINSLTHDLLPQGEFNFVLKIKGDYYWRYVEYGVTGANIPYDASVRTGAGNSKYIEGLMNWIKIKGIASDNDVVRGIAFAIARKQTAKGGEGLGNPMDKNKLGFVSKSKIQIDKEVNKLATIYQSEVQRIVANALPENILITI